MVELNKSLKIMHLIIWEPIHLTTVILNVYTVAILDKGMVMVDFNLDTYPIVRNAGDYTMDDYEDPDFEIVEIED